MTTTDIPAADAMIGFTVTLTSPLHHGAGNAGNTAVLRTQDIIRPGGKLAAVPYLSGNSLRHSIRDALAWHAVSTLGVEDGSLGKAVTDLVWSGGGISSTGAQVDLALARRVDAVFPALGLLGYAAGSDITAGTLRVSHLHLMCEENAWRAPVELAGSNLLTMPAGRFRGEDFGTRHDTAGTAVDRYVDTLAAIAGTNQMIYDLQVLKTGSVLWGDLSLTPAATLAHRRVLLAALALLAPDGTVHLGAKTAVGYGQATVSGWPDGRSDLRWWTQFLQERGEQVVALWRDIAA